MVLAIAGAGCVSDDPMTGVTVLNDTATTITVGFVRDGAMITLAGPIEAGREATFGSYHGTCSPAPVLALDPAGRVVARHDAPLCAADRWAVGAPRDASP